jgi:hypothetical protein
MAGLAGVMPQVGGWFTVTVFSQRLFKVVVLLPTTT